MKTEEIIKALRECASIDWSVCEACYRKDLEEESCFDALKMDAADRLDELQERCIRYAEEAMELKARLARYEDAEKDGRLVVLPCKVMDTVWVDCREAIVEEFFGYETERYLHAQFYDNFDYIDIPFMEIGKTVFLTREEAEAALLGKGGETDAE